jgi:hypothetical protein
MMHNLPRTITGSLLALSALAGCQPSVSSEADATSPSALATDGRAFRPPGVVPQGTGNSDPKVTPRAVNGRQGAMARASTVRGAESGPVRPRLAVRAKGKRDITFDDLEFKIERDGDFDPSMLSPSIEELNGAKVVIRGFMLASSVLQQSGIKQFVLVRDNQQCCFGPGAYVYHNMRVEVEDGKSTSFAVRPVTVEGTLTIDPWVGVDGKCYSVYHMRAQRVW